MTTLASLLPGHVPSPHLSSPVAEETADALIAAVHDLAGLLETRGRVARSARGPRFGAEGLQQRAPRQTLGGRSGPAGVPGSGAPL